MGNGACADSLSALIYKIGIYKIILIFLQFRRCHNLYLRAHF